MSNYLAIATVTETLRHVLEHFLQQDVSGATGTSVRPSGLNNTGTGNGLPAVGVNVCLYQIMPNATARNLDLPTRRSDASQVQRPRAAIDLHYMLSAYGAEATLEPQRVIGSVIRTIHTYSFLSRDFIDEAVAGASFLLNSDLSRDIELVKFTPLALTLDELSRVWSVYFQTSYALSVCYQASVVYLEDTSTPAAALPVRLPNIVTTPILVPSIDSISPQPATAGALLTITGDNVGVAGPNIVIGDASPIPATVVSSSEITFTLPPTTPAGVSALSIVQLVNFGTTASPQLRPGVASSVAPMALAPTITSLNPPSVARGAKLTVAFDTPIGRAQSVALLVGSNAILLPGRLATDPATAQSFDFTIPADLPTGTALVRLQVDGVESALTYDASVSSYTKPTVIIT